MARAATMKVYRTAIGFHDAYVAASSQKAALEAWGSDKNLFARGAAEIVTDEKLTTEPLASPGKVVKRLRGTAAEQMAALPQGKPKAAKTSSADRPHKPARGARAKAAPPPPPSRSALEKADAVLASMQQRGRSAIEELDRRQAKLAQERRKLLAAIATEEEQLTSQRDAEADKYDRAIKRWKSG